MLEEALMAYEGAALLVSHDRFFIGRVANRIVEVRDGELVLYRGDYAYYQEKKREEAEESERLEQERRLATRREEQRQKQKAKAAQKGGGTPKGKTAGTADS
jgi:ATP-binding cassette subfamily F protein 3